MSRRTRGLLVAAALVAIAALSAFKIHGILQRGEPVFWLAELWAPAAVLSIGLVTCIEFLLPRPHADAPIPAPAPLKRKKGRK